MKTMPVALLLIVLATLFRVLPPLLQVHHSWMSNFSPLASLILCGAVFFPKRMAAWVPLVILLVSDAVLNLFVYHFPLLSWDIIPKYLVFGVVVVLAFRHRLSLRAKPFALMGACFAGALLYFLVTNSASWLGEPLYTKNLAGWWQSMTIGLPGYPPTWLFFRNSVVSDFLFTALFMICMAVTIKKESVAVVGGGEVAAGH